MQRLTRVLGSAYRIRKVWSLFFMKRSGLRVGKRFHLGNGYLDKSFLHLISIGDDVLLAGRGVTILAHDSSTKCHLNYTRIGKVVIGNRVFIGSGSTILPGVTIGDDVVIGAGSVVTHDIPERSVAKGNPAEVTGTIEEFLDRKKQEMLTYPVFGEEYHVLHKSVGRAQKDEMNARMKDKFGYIV